MLLWECPAQRLLPPQSAGLAGGITAVRSPAPQLLLQPQWLPFSVHPAIGVLSRAASLRRCRDAAGHRHALYRFRASPARVVPGARFPARHPGSLACLVELATPFWKAAPARFMPPVSEALPGTLLARFTATDPLAQLSRALRFLAPLSTLSEGR